MYSYITELDAAIGEIQAKLAATGLLENTILIFSSDNGAPPYGSDTGTYINRNYPYR